MIYKVLKVKKGKRIELIELVSEDGDLWKINQGITPINYSCEDKHIFKILKAYKDDGYTIIEIMDNTKLEEFEEKATKKQKWYIHELIKDIGWDEEKYRSFLLNNFRINSSKELSKKDASKLIEKLINIKNGIQESELELADILI